MTTTMFRPIYGAGEGSPAATFSGIAFVSSGPRRPILAPPAGSWPWWRLRRSA